MGLSILHQIVKMKAFIVISLALISCVTASSFPGSGTSGFAATSGSGTSGSDRQDPRFLGAIIGHVIGHVFGTDGESGESVESSVHHGSSWDMESSFDPWEMGSSWDMETSWDMGSSWDIPSSWDMGSSAF